MKVRRILVVLAALFVLVGSAPTAAGSTIESRRSQVGSGERSAPEGGPSRELPRLAALSVGHRVAIARLAADRRPANGTTKIRAHAVVDLATAAARRAAGVDVEANARLLRASNTPCCVRGPPAAH